MKLTTDQVRHVAKLANLPVTEDETEKYTDQLSEILNYVEKLSQADTKEVEPTFNVTGLFNVMRGDKVEEELPQDVVLQNAPAKKDGFFVTRGVFEE